MTPARTLRATLAAAVAAGFMSGCSSSGAPSSSASPLTLAEMAAKYTAAANAYNAGVMPITLLESKYCDPHSANVSLPDCQSALRQDRQTTISFDNALRAVNFAGQAATDVTRLLSDDAALEHLLDQAASAPSISAIAQLTNQTFTAFFTAAEDAKKVRAALHLALPT